MNSVKFLFCAVILSPTIAGAQERYATRSGHVSFFSETPLENIDAHNYKATCVFDGGTGAVELAVLMKAFEFEKALMQEHFNENYVESDKFPKAVFKGKVSGLPEGALGKPGTYDVTVAGDLTMHGVAKPVSTPAKLTVDAAGALKATTEFEVVPEDHGIEIPKTVQDNIAKQIKVKVDLSLPKMQ